jgi:hypothetical protein
MKESIRFVLIIACGGLAFGQNPGTFSATGKMTVSRYGGFTATLLANGKVLIAGGENPPDKQPFLRSAELYDPRTRAFTRTGDMIFNRSYHSATLLPDGRVLIAGGTDRYVGSPPVATAELYDPDTETFSVAGDMIDVASNTAILLPAGKVLLAHDGESGSLRVPAELYDPAAGTFSPTGDQVGIPGHHQAALLSDGRVLLAICCRSEQIYDPATGTFGYTDKMSGIYQDGFAAASLPNGRVLVQGGFLEELNVASAGADLYDPSQGLFNPTGQMTMARYYHTATVLGAGTVLIAGGFGNPISDPTATATTAEIYDPARGTFFRTGDLTTARIGHTATLLLDGTVLITGGDGMGTAEIYSPVKLVSAPRLFPIPGDTQGQGAIWHADTGEIASSSHPAARGEILSMYTTDLATDGAMPPQVAVGGRLAEVQYFGPAPEYPGYFQVNFTMPGGITPESSVPVRLTYLGRPSNKVTIAVR